MMEIMPSNFFLHLHMQEITKALAFGGGADPTKCNQIWYVY